MCKEEIAYIAPFDALHGEAYVNRRLFKLLSKNKNIYMFDTSKGLILLKLAKFISYSFNLFFNKSVKFIIISPSRKVIFLIFYLLILLIFSQRAKTYVYIHGSELFEYANISWYRRLIGSLLKLNKVTLVVPEIEFGFTAWEQYVEKIIEIPNPISDVFFATPQEKDVSRRITFTFISVPHKNKNIDKAIRFALENNGDLTVLGWTKRDYMRLYKTNVIPPNITFLGVQPATNVKETLLSADYLISCSDKEFQPLVVLEAIMCGCSVLVGRHRSYEILQKNYENVYFIDEYVTVKKRKFDYQQDQLKIKIRHMPQSFKERWAKLV